ncbi:MAG: type II secretion system protein [Verrucomicrobia bacterium]|nr:type II secretion system protein [Verrucomicrobiota bacterium]
MNYYPKKRSGFTLIELLTVIAIIGILAAVLFPGVQGVMKKAKQSSAGTKVRNITQAYIAFASTGNKYVKSGTWSLTANTSASSISDFAAVLAFNANLNTAEIWYVEADKLNESASFPRNVLDGAPGSQTINSNFSSPSSTNGYQSWTTYAPTSRNLDEKLPLFWARGLSTSGAWDATNGVWGSEGGHIAFGDSHVVWVQDTTSDETKFIKKSDGSTATVNWKEAVSTGTVTELKSI